MKTMKNDVVRSAETAKHNDSSVDVLVDQLVQEAIAGECKDVRGFVLSTGKQSFPEAFDPRNSRLTPEGRDRIIATVQSRQEEFGEQYDTVMNQLRGFRLQPSEYL